VFGLLRMKWRGTCESMNVRPARRHPAAPVGAAAALGHLAPQRLLLAHAALFLLSIAGAGLPGGAHDHPSAQAAGAGREGPRQRHQPPAAGPDRRREIRQASAAFNAMQARIRQYIIQRTQMLAAITHDLQTPLTRMRLRLEKVERAKSCSSA
jgi:signal transduction histidine kinase